VPIIVEKKTIGEIITEARKQSGLSLRAVARRVPVNFSYLAEIEKGKRMPSEKIIKALSEQSELNLDFDHMMAHSGRIGEEAETYLKKHPNFGRVIRNVAKKKLNDEQLNTLNETVDKLKS